MADKSQQTEQATPRRIEKAREEGRFPAAKELVSGLQFLAFVMLLSWGAGSWVARMRRLIRLLVERAFRSEMTSASVFALARMTVENVIFPLLAAGIGLAVLSVGVRLATTRMGVNWKGLAPDFARLNGFARLKDLPRQNVPALLQAMIMLPLAAVTVYAMARQNLASYLALPFQGVEAGALTVAQSLLALLWKAAMVFVVFGAVDMFRQHRRYLKDLRMSKQEIRDEHKEVEGNPQIKARIRRIQRDVLRKRMMQEVPKATAVIVNPTHYAVAIRYDLDSMAAPKVVAKGKNYLALRIREKAIAHEVPIVENPPLAQALYKSVEIGQEIPPHLYRAVAEILAYIYRLMNGRGPG
jgi:flagellar biosynthetic protein FlhB